MSQQTQPQQKQAETVRRGVTAGITNLLSRSNMSSIANQSSSFNNIDFDFFELNYETKKEEKGWVYTWGSGEMGQLGYDIKVISKMPKDREGYPYQPQPFQIETLKDRIFQISGGDGHTVAIDIKGKVYSWGASACGQLGLSSMKDLPTDIEGYPYQPTPRAVDLLSDAKIIQISWGDAHTVALSSDGKLYSWGGGGCGQLGHPDTQSMPKDEDGCPYQPKPKLISALRTMQVKQIACGKAHTVAVLENGHLYSWGAGACGQLGHPDTSSFPSDEDGYPFQPIPRWVYALKNLFLVHACWGDVHTMVLTLKGEIYCFGGGSWGQLGLGNISQLPLDVDSCPFMPVPQKIDTLNKEFIVKLSWGDSHSMALTKEGIVYAWGEATCGQLGFEDLKNLPRNADGRVYQPIPQKVIALEKKKVVEISWGEAHSLVLTDKGHVFGIGANSWGQLGQWYTEMKQSDAEEIFFTKNSDNMTGDSFWTYLETSSLHSNENSRDSKGDEESVERWKKGDKDKYDNNSDEEAIKMIGSPTPSSLPQMTIFEEKQKESVSLTPKLIKSLMHRRVLKISSGGVHNICIVEPYPNNLANNLYKQFMSSKFTDVSFVFKEKNFCFRDNNEEDKNDSEEEASVMTRPKNKLRKGYFEYRINAHKFILASRSQVFKDLFKKHWSRKAILEKKGDINQTNEGPTDSVLIKEWSFRAFRLLIDYIYLDNLNVLDDVWGWNELTEILKLAKQYQLPKLLERWERQFLTLPSLQLFKNSFDLLIKISNRNNSESTSYADSDDPKMTPSDVISKSLNAGPEIQDIDNSFRRSMYSKKLFKQKNENLDGVMFLADGRVLIVNNELYQEVMKKGIIIDLNNKKGRIDNDGSGSQSPIEESKEYVHSHTKSENPRSITQNKKLKKLVTGGSSSVNTKRTLPTTEEVISDGISKKRQQVPLGKELWGMLNNKEFSDIIISIDGKEIYAHKAVLSSRSTYFEAMFNHDFTESAKDKVILRDVSSFELFYNLLEFMYCDSTKINVRNAFDMLSLSEEYGVTWYKEKWEILLSKYITITTVCLIFRYANEYNCQRLKETCLVYMEENYDEVIYSSGFEELDKDEMLLIIRLCKDKKAFKAM